MTRQVQFDVAIDLSNIASSLARLGQQDAVSYYQRSIALREPLVAAVPKDALARLSLGTAHSASAALFKAGTTRRRRRPREPGD